MSDPRARSAGGGAPRHGRTPRRRADGRAARPGRAGSWGRRPGRTGPAPGAGGALVLLAIVGLVTRPENFATTVQPGSILSLASTIGVITVGVTFVIIGGGIDLSVGALMALASVWATTLATQDYGPVVMVICALLVGTGAGLVNGLLIAYGRLVPFIATLAMLVAARGLAQRMSDRKTQLVQPATRAIVDLSTTRVLGIPLLVYIFALVVVLGWIAAQPHDLRPAHLRGRRQPGGGPAGRHQRRGTPCCCTRCPGCAAASPRS